MKPNLAAWNDADKSVALRAMLACCAARRWAQSMVSHRPFRDIGSLSLTADEVWSTMEEPDWLEAFAAHPRIGERRPPPAATQSAAWSQQEQSSTANAASQVLADLAAGNALYEQRFGFTYIVCATGKNADEMLTILRRRLNNNRSSELREAAEQQRQIMQIRLGKWLVE
jgi:2-oxo-4-hydroxy-4-carboxy-5-ureidoimidazoline decarboxylase